MLSYAPDQSSRSKPVSFPPRLLIEQTADDLAIYSLYSDMTNTIFSLNGTLDIPLIEIPDLVELGQPYFDKSRWTTYELKSRFTYFSYYRSFLRHVEEHFGKVREKASCVVLRFGAKA